MLSARRTTGWLWLTPAGQAPARKRAFTILDGSYGLCTRPETLIFRTNFIPPPINSKHRFDSAVARSIRTPLTYLRQRRMVTAVSDQDVFEKMLETARWMRQRRRERLARLAGLAGRGRARKEPAVDVRSIRALTGLSQAKFAELLSIEVATLRNWEQGRREPTGAARALLRAIRNNPIAVIKALSD